MEATTKVRDTPTEGCFRVAMQMWDGTQLKELDFEMPKSLLLEGPLEEVINQYFRSAAHHFKYRFTA